MLIFLNCFVLCFGEIIHGRTSKYTSLDLSIFLFLFIYRLFSARVKKNLRMYLRIEVYKIPYTADVHPLTNDFFSDMT